MSYLINNSKRVFILGAGSSISHDSAFPSINKFFAKAKEIGIDIKKNFPDLHDYIFNNFGIDVTSRKNEANIETIFTNIEIDLERYQEIKLESVRQQLLKLIKNVLIELVNRCGNKEGNLHKFSDRLKDSDTVLTFNWDILLDEILSKKKILDSDFKNIHKYKGYKNFFVKLSAHRLSFSDEVGIEEPYSIYDNKTGYYLKLHGSIDWVYCNNEQCLGFGEGFPIEKIDQQHFCSKCHELMHPLIIPPVLNKQYRKFPLIRRLWNIALKETESVEEIVIWGYSLPETDFYSMWLLKNARRNLKTLTLINPGVIQGKREKRINKNFVERFSNIYKNVIEKDTINLYEIFEDFLNDNDVYKKYGIKRQ